MISTDLQDMTEKQSIFFYKTLNEAKQLTVYESDTSDEAIEVKQSKKVVKIVKQKVDIKTTIFQMIKSNKYHELVRWLYDSLPYHIISTGIENMTQQQSMFFCKALNEAQQLKEQYENKVALVHPAVAKKTQEDILKMIINDKYNDLVLWLYNNFPYSTGVPYMTEQESIYFHKAWHEVACLQFKTKTILKMILSFLIFLII